MRLIEDNAKCRHLKKLTCKGTLRQEFKLFICLRPRNPYTIPFFYQHDCLDLLLQSINSDKRLPQSTFTGKYF
jgi:hypothetical protein